MPGFLNLLLATRTGYTVEQIDHAVSTLEGHEVEVLNAVQNISPSLPSRFRFASDAAAKSF